jgi:hypothetical protein
LEDGRKMTFAMTLDLCEKNYLDLVLQLTLPPINLPTSILVV